MRLISVLSCTAVVALASFAAAQVPSQAKSVPGQPEPVPPLLQGKPLTPDPTIPPARPFHDDRYGVSFTVPAAWTITRKDAEVSTFKLDARTVARTTQMRVVASISFNPYPASTFSGALFYFSVTPHVAANQCVSQASAKAPRTVSVAEIGGLQFIHGYDEHGGICTESRDEIYTAQRGDSCYRFDAVINSFCGGDVSGVRDMTDRELDAVRKRMQRILDSVRFDAR